MTTLHITSEKLHMDEVVQLRWTTHRDLDAQGDRSTEAAVRLHTPKGAMTLEFVKGGPFSLTGGDIRLVAVRDEEGILVDDADFVVKRQSSKAGRPSAGRDTRIQAMITPDLAEWLEDDARQDGESMSDVVFRLLDERRRGADGEADCPAV
jgi:hypothetical protein